MGAVLGADRLLPPAPRGTSGLRTPEFNVSSGGVNGFSSQSYRESLSCSQSGVSESLLKIHWFLLLLPCTAGTSL